MTFNWLTFNWIRPFSFIKCRKNTHVGTATRNLVPNYVHWRTWHKAPGGVIRSNRVVVVGSHPEVTEALVDVVAEEPGLLCAGAARSVAEAMALIQFQEPDVVLFDLEAVAANARWLARETFRYIPRARLVGLSSYDDASSIRRTIAAGFHHHVSKTHGIADLTKILLEDNVFLA